MSQPDLLHRITTPVGQATAELVDTWLGVTSTGELLTRDVWEVTLHAEDLELQARVMTFPDPSPEQLALAVQTDIAAALS